MMIYYQDDVITVRAMTDTDIDELVKEFDMQCWTKPRTVLEDYYSQQNSSRLSVFIAEYKNHVAGYVTLIPKTSKGPFTGLPELSDFNVFSRFQRRGIGSKILDVAEKTVSELSDSLTLGVGLHSGYGSAQRLYVKRGYIPDGSGVWYRDKPLEQYAVCNNDDDLVLYMKKILVK